MKKARIIAFYLPQFHPIPENDRWWGKGFTEWTNVGRAKPLFRGHRQPRVPADLGYYDLRLQETREEQAALARKAGIEGFCYYHYWFGNGRQLLEKPFNEVLYSGKPNFPFCLCWANHSWTNKTWEKSKRKSSNPMLMEQLYPGEEDFIAHFNNVLPAFMDNRYLRVDGKPIFLIFHPYFREVSDFIKTWRMLAKKNGLQGIHFIGITQSTLSHIYDESWNPRLVLPNLSSSSEIYNSVLKLGFDGVCSAGKRRGELLANGKWIAYAKDYLSRHCSMFVNRYDYRKVARHMLSPEDTWENVYPDIFPQWDRTARTGNAEGVYINSTPEEFKKLLKRTIEVVSQKEDNHKLIFVNSWNEWAEGSYLEPDLDYGTAYLDVIKESVF